MIDRYEQAVAGARSAATGRVVFLRLNDRDGDEVELLRLLAAVCSGARLLTESVDSWTRRSGERCVALGYLELGESLQLDADRQESRHAALVDTWQHLTQATVDGRAIVESTRQWLPPRSGIDRHVELNEAVVEGQLPFAKAAIEFEVERLSAAFWALLVVALREVTTPSPELVSFLRAVREDAADRSTFSLEQMRALLFNHPDTIHELIGAGRLALDSFGEFLDDCWAWAASTTP